MAAKKEAGRLAPMAGFGDAKADRLFRENPSARLLLMARVIGENPSSRYDLAPKPFGANKQEVRSLALLLSLRNFLARNDNDTNLASQAFRDAPEQPQAAWERMARENPKLAPWAELGGLGVKVFMDHWGSGEARQQWNNAPAREKQELLKAVEAAFVEEFARLCEVKIPDGELEEALALGRQKLSDKHGWSLATLDRLESDPELALAVGRLAFGGATELAALDQGRGGNYSGISAMMPDVDANLLTDALPADHFWRSMVGEVAEIRDRGAAEGAAIARREKTLRALGVALRAEGAWADKAREAILALSDTGEGSSWERVPPCGDVYYRQAEGGPKKILGAGRRGENAKDALGRLHEILQWRKPLDGSIASAAPGILFARAMFDHAQGRETGAPQAMACALEALSKHPKLGPQIGSAFASRVAQGFAGIGKDASMEELFPELPEVIEREVEREAAESSALGWAKKARLTDPMAPLSLAAGKALRLSAANEMELVGEAKKSLASAAGLTPAGWRALTSDPALAQAFAAMAFGGPQKSAPARKQVSIKAAEEVMKAADARGDAFLSKLFSIAAKERQSLPMEAAGRALSAAAMAGLGAPQQRLLIEFLAQNEKAARIAAGRLPTMPVGWRGWRLPTMPVGWRGWREERDADNEDAAARAGALKEDVEALISKGPALIKGICDRLAREVSRAIKAGASEQEARGRAFEEVGSQISDLCDGIGSQPPGFWAGLDKKDPYGSALRAVEAWERARRDDRAKADPHYKKSWRAEVGVLRSGRVEARELCSGEELFNEGRAMSHCVGSYAERCARGASRVFSVKIAGARQTTLELRPKGPKGLDMERWDAESPLDRAHAREWVVAQNRGKHNSNQISQEIKDACDAFAKAYGEAFATNTVRLAKELRERRAQEAAGAPGDLAAKAQARRKIKEEGAMPIRQAP